MNDSTPAALPTKPPGAWAWLLLRGILAVVFGIVALAAPGIALAAPGIALVAIAIVFGSYALVDGVVTAIQAVRARGLLRPWGWLLAQGILSALAGTAALVMPGLVGAVAGLFVLWTIVTWSLVHGFAGIRSAAGAAHGRARTWGIGAGILGIAFGIVLGALVLLSPGASLLGLVWAVGGYAFLFGAMLLVAALELRRAVGRPALAEITPATP